MSDPSPFEGRTPVASLAHTEGAVTLVEGQSFCLSGRTGDMATDFPHGLFVLDTRVLSRWELRVNGHRLEPLTVDSSEPFNATFAGRSHPAAGRADADLVVFRTRHVGRGMRERIAVTNHGLSPAPVTLELFCDADFADLFEVKESRVRHRGRHSQELDIGEIRFGHRDDGVTKEVAISFSESPAIEPGLATWRATLPPGSSRELCVEVSVTVNRRRVEPLFTCSGSDDAAIPAVRLAEWRATLPTVDTDDAALAQAIVRSREDLGALRIFDPEHPETPILAAGAPWFMTVFGRDSLLTAWMTLIADPSLARGVLETLARFQGNVVDPETEEEPGKILHEMRFGAAAGLALGGGDVYYGSIDATPLFVMLLGELRRWDLGDDLVARLLPHADRALEWIDQFGDADGDGFVEYERRSNTGLVNQGWKDSWDGIRFAGGEIAEPPIALCEVQGYVYAAYVARAHFAREADDEETYEKYRVKALDLRTRFNEAFWLEDHGWYALGLDRDDRPIDALASNMGHCLWTGIVDPERAGHIARHLLSPEMFSGWGVRTLASSMAAYNPVSYHNGSVWPHDNAICAAGLARYGFVDEAHRIIEAQLDVAAAYGGRLPELFAGFDRQQLGSPASYPTSCSPQAWASASPLLWLRTILGINPWAPHNQLWIHPELPPSITRLRAQGIAIAGHDVTVAVDRAEITVEEAGDLEVVHRRRPPLTASLDPSSTS